MSLIPAVSPAVGVQVAVAASGWEMGCGGSDGMQGEMGCGSMPSLAPKTNHAGVFPV